MVEIAFFDKMHYCHKQKRLLLDCFTGCMWLQHVFYEFMCMIAGLCTRYESPLCDFPEKDPEILCPKMWFGLSWRRACLVSIDTQQPSSAPLRLNKDFTWHCLTTTILSHSPTWTKIWRTSLSLRRTDTLITHCQRHHINDCRELAAANDDMWLFFGIVILQGVIHKLRQRW